ncbi:MAG: DNA mismatch repair endonuclease MutL, partial [Lachnospiraceae bacterium]|nr:DNA mismatch repair endonuclease MutL [Lachnospiraceae bacterium]
MIKVLDSKTIDKIAAGEVIERPSSVIKELLENAIDAGATAVSIEIKKGGIDYIRVTDNGEGIDKNEVRTAFLPHATSKLNKIEDLFTIESLGFRGEALPSIASVSKVELLTKTVHEPVGFRYVIEGGTEVSFEEAGLPDGTTFIVRDLFYNTPARRKFLKTDSTEAGHITSLVEEIAMANPGVSVKYTANGRNILVTRGNNDLKEVIYRIYGREIADSLIQVNEKSGNMTLEGFISKPVVARNSRAMENYFVNSRFVKDETIERAIEDGYSGFLMQHRFPFTVLKLAVSPEDLDVNVHPRKMEIKFSEGPAVYEFIRESVRKSLSNREFINSFTLDKDEPVIKAPAAPVKAPEPFENRYIVKEEVTYDSSEDTVPGHGELFNEQEEVKLPEENGEKTQNSDSLVVKETPSEEFKEDITGTQEDFFDEKILSKDAFSEYRIVGQLFNTYWIIEYKDQMLLMDQHAAHEKVNFERFMKQFKERSVITQNLNPPIILTLDGKHREILERFLIRFTEMGFEIEPFGGNDFAVRTVPYNLYGLNDNEVLTALLDELSEGTRDEDISLIYDKIASMSCKSAVKGGYDLSYEEAENII